MKSELVILFLAAFFAASSSYAEIADEYDVVVVRENNPTTLGCAGNKLTGDMSINWMVKPGNVEEDGGLYTCLMKHQKRKVKEIVYLLAVFTVSLYPAPPVPQNSILRLIGRVTPDIAVTKITWTAPGGLLMKTERKPNTGTVTKLPLVQKSDGGTYTCTVYPQGNSTGVLAATVNLTVDADKVAPFTSSEQPDHMIHTGTEAQKAFLLTCPSVQGDCVKLSWLPSNFNRGKYPDYKKMKLVYKYDRWRGSAQRKKAGIRLAGLPYNAKAGSFSFQMSLDLSDGGIYICQVFLNDNIFLQNTTLSVLKVKTSNYSSKLELLCRFSEPHQVYRAVWEHSNESRQLVSSSRGPGSISTTLPLPITSDVVGRYTCILQLKNGQIIRADTVITVPSKVQVSATTPSLLSKTSPSLFALLLPVPLVAAAVGVLLWRQKHISDRGIEQSLSVHSGEAENLYENPEDFRQVMKSPCPLMDRSFSNIFLLALPQGSVYMDLKPRGDGDVYKELERCNKGLCEQRNVGVWT
ncbi:g6f-like isoform X10 [Nothobranchius furzeri]|uniref:g6f-like isoform X10 n=1 Tax=Nothobranchius furzeri TaxID=105023 RepID=UPI003904C756